MKVKVKERFVDKVTREFYQIGQAIKITDNSRVHDLINRGLVDPIKTEKVETADKTPKKKK